MLLHGLYACTYVHAACAFDAHVCCALFLSVAIDAVAIPSAQEFADAIQSLSEEQQRFAKHFRSMQLSSTLFAVAGA
jgi:hypothetical protein